MIKEDFIQNNVCFNIFNTIYYFLMMNIYFGLTNALFLITVVTFTFKIQNVLIFAIALIPTGPSISALIYCLNKYNKEKLLNISSDFFTGYKVFFKKAISVWLVSLLLITILIIDLLFFMKTQYIGMFAPIIFIAFYVVLITAINYFYYLVKNENSSIKDLLKISFYFSLRKFYFGIVNLIIVLSLFFITPLMPVFAIVILPSIFIYLIYTNNTYLYKSKE